MIKEIDEVASLIFPEISTLHDDADWQWLYTILHKKSNEN